MVGQGRSARCGPRAAGRPGVAAVSDGAGSDTNGFGTTGPLRRVVADAGPDYERSGDRALTWKRFRSSPCRRHATAVGRSVVGSALATTPRGVGELDVRLNEETRG